MPKLFQIVFALALVIPFSNLAHADDLLGLDLPEYLEPIDIANDATVGDETIPASDDLFLGLDLPSDFDEVPTAENPAPEAKAESTATPTAATTSGTGGKITADSTAKTTSTPTTSSQNFVAPTPNSLFNSQIASANVVDSQSYSTHSGAQLSDTGPAATATFAFLVALGLAFFFRKKFSRV